MAGLFKISNVTLDNHIVARVVGNDETDALVKYARRCRGLGFDVQSPVFEVERETFGLPPAMCENRYYDAHFGIMKNPHYATQVEQCGVSR